ncbi:hypothetical protein PG989_012696 [Apiospora arundinis]
MAYSSDPELPEYQLQTFSLDSHPEYVTILYCWSDPTPCHTVLIDGKELRIARSAATILELMSSITTSESRMIWIDALCIDQLNFTERAHQVPLMSRIYPQGTRNIIYLGVGDPLSSRGMDNMREIAKDMIRMQSEDRDELQTAVDKKAISAFLQLPWFSRVWVVQESVLARGSSCILGRNELDFEIICRVVMALYGSFLVISFVAKFDGFVGAMSVLVMFQARERMAQKMPFDFNYTLVVTMTTQCTNLRDKIFGILGLCKAGMKEAEPLSLLAVDYNKSHQNIYRDATRCAVMTIRLDQLAENEQESCILHWISHSCESDLHDPKLPSWVPAYHRKLDYKQDGHALAVFGVGAIPEGDKQLVREQWDDPNVLELRGCVFDKVSQVSPVFDPAMFTGDLAQLRDQLALVQAMVQNVGTPRTDQNQLARILIVDTNYKTQPSTPEDWAGFQSMLDCLEKAPNRLVASLSDDDGADRSGDSSEYSGDPELMYYRVLVQACLSRRFIVTESGALGLGPKISQAGDTVAALLVDCGGAPYLLRSDEGSNAFKLVGHCYLDGYMPGREKEGVKGGDTHNEWLKIT